MAAGISAQGLTGFARDNMGLPGPWPYLLFFALDGAAGVCAVLLMRRAARAEAAARPAAGRVGPGRRPPPHSTGPTPRTARPPPKRSG